MFNKVRLCPLESPETIPPIKYVEVGVEVGEEVVADGVVAGVICIGFSGCVGGIVTDVFL